MNQLRFSLSGVHFIVTSFILSPGFWFAGLAADSTAEVPFTLLRGTHVIVEGRMGERHKINMLIDTGAATTTVDQRLAERLGLQTRALRVTGMFQGPQTVREARLPSFTLGIARVEGWDALVLDLSQVRLGERIDLIVGLDILHQLPGLTIDYTKRVLNLTCPAALETKVAVERNLPLLRIQMAVQGASLALAVDSGADGLLLFEDRVKEKLPQLCMREIVSLGHVGGNGFGRRVELADVTLGNRSWGRLSATLTGTQAPADLGIDGLISLQTLDAQRVSIDFKNSLLSWE